MFIIQNKKDWGQFVWLGFFKQCSSMATVQLVKQSKRTFVKNILRTLCMCGRGGGAREHEGLNIKICIAHNCRTCSICCTQCNVLNILHSICCIQYVALDMMYSICCTQYDALNMLCSIWCTQYFALNMLCLICCIQYVALNILCLICCVKYLALNMLYSILHIVAVNIVHRNMMVSQR